MITSHLKYFPLKKIFLGKEWVAAQKIINKLVDESIGELKLNYRLWKGKALNPPWQKK